MGRERALGRWAATAFGRSHSSPAGGVLATAGGVPAATPRASRGRKVAPSPQPCTSSFALLNYLPAQGWPVNQGWYLWYCGAGTWLCRAVYKSILSHP